MRLFFFVFSFAFYGWSQTITINTISIEGNKKSKVSYLQKLISTKNTHTLDSLKIKDDITRLIREPAVSHAYFTIEKLANNKNQLIYHIEENKTLIPAVDIWTTIDDKGAYHFGVNEYNFLGRGYLVGLFYRKNVFDGFGLILSNPNFIKNTFGLSGIFQKRNTYEPVNYDTQSAFYNYKFLSSDVEFSYKPNIKNTLTVGVGFLTEDYKWVEGDEFKNISLAFSTQKFLLKLGFDRNHQEQQYYFFTGIRNQLRTNFVWGENFGGDNSFYAIENETTYFKRINDKGNWANRIKLGVSKNIKTPFPAFVIDNNLNIRGIGNKVNRGSLIGVINTEYRHTVLERKWLAIQANGFLDYSSLLPSGENLKDILKKENSHLYGGIGFRFIHKFIHSAIVRIDYGFSLKDPSKKGLVFGIGQYF